MRPPRLLNPTVSAVPHSPPSTPGPTPRSSLAFLELINAGCDATKSLSIDEILSRYLLTMKTQSLRERSFLSLYTILTYLIHHQPFVLNHIVDRARAAYAIGDLVKAAEDIHDAGGGDVGFVEERFFFDLDVHGVGAIDGHGL